MQIAKKELDFKGVIVLNGLLINQVLQGSFYSKTVHSRSKKSFKMLCK